MNKLNLSKPLEDFPKVMHGHFETLNREVEQLEATERHVQIGVAFLALFNEAFEKCSLSMWGHNGISLKLITDDMTSVLPALRWLRHKGYRCHTANEAPTARTKSWIFAAIRDDGSRAHSWDLQVEATLSTGSVKCEYVQVGVKEEPVYELRCGGKKAEAPRSVEVPGDLV